MNNLKELRLQKGLRQIDIAKEFNIAKSTYCCYEKGINEPDIKTLIKLADYFYCSIDYLLGRESEDGTIYIRGYDLSNEEIALIDSLRKMEQSDREFIIKLIQKTSQTNTSNTTTDK